jgi:conjugal transfer pilus assembly protein TraF
VKRTLSIAFLLLVTGAQAATVSTEPSQSAFPPAAFSSTGTYVDAPIVGWHWYNEPQPEEEDEPEQARQRESVTDQLHRVEREIVKEKEIGE